MKTISQWRMITVLGLGLLGVLPLRGDVTNQWTATGNGYWDESGKWSAGVAPSNDHWICITNAGSKTVTIDSTTSGTYPATMSILSLMIGAPSGATNTLALTTAGTNVPLAIAGYASIQSGGELRISNGAVQVGSSVYVDGQLSLSHANSLLIATNGYWAGVEVSKGIVRQSAGALLIRDLEIGRYDTSNTFRPTVSLSGGKQVLLGNLTVGGGMANSTGVLQIMGGELVTTNGYAQVGASAVGEVLFTGGVWRAADIFLGAQTNTLGTILMTGGQILAPEGDFIVGRYGHGRMTISNGTWQADSLKVGNGQRLADTLRGDNPSLGHGWLTIAGGSVLLQGDLKTGGYVLKDTGFGTTVLGPCTGEVLMVGGELVTTNGSALLDEAGSMTISGGVWRARTVQVGVATIMFSDPGTGRLTIAGGTNLVSQSMQLGVPSEWSGQSSTGAVWITAGQLVVTNSSGDARLGIAIGSLTMDGGVVAADRLLMTNYSFSGADPNSLNMNGGEVRLSSSIIGSYYHEPLRLGSYGKRAVLRLGGETTNQFLTSLFVGCGAGATGEVVLAGGLWQASSVMVGSNGVGSVTTSNGVWKGSAHVGVGTGARGALLLAGGTNDFGSALRVGSGDGATGSVVVSGGSLFLSDWSSDTNIVGAGGVGQVTISNGTVDLGNVRLADGDQGRGTLTLVGGSTTARSLVATNSRAIVTLNRGSLSISSGSEIANGQVLGVGSSGRQFTLMLQGTNRFEDGLTIAGAANSTGTVVVAAGQLWVTNADLQVGETGIGALTVSNGLVMANVMRVGANAGSAGTLIVAGGTNHIASFLTVARYAGSTGSVIVSGGRLVITNDLAYIGNSSVGSLTVSNGAWLSEGVRVGNNTGGNGTLTLVGGASLLSSNLWIGYAAGATGSVLVTGGTLTTTNQGVTLGYSGRGEMVYSGGTWRVASVLLGQNAGATGVLTVVANTLAVTNAEGAGSLEVRRGSLVLAGGTLVLDTLLATNNAGKVQLDDGELRLRGSLVDNGSRLSLGAAGGEAVMRVMGGTNRFEDGIELAGAAGATGTVWLSGGSLLVTNNNTYVGLSGVGAITVSNGVWNARDVTVGRNPASSGTVTLLGGTNVFSSFLSLGSLEESTGAVLVAGGRLVVTNNATYVGNLGVGRFTVSNGTWLAREVSVGEQTGASGTLLVAGGTSVLASNLWVGYAAGATGALLVTGGELVATNHGVLIGNSGLGTATVSGGVWRAVSVVLGQSSSSVGNVTISGGSVTVTNATGGGNLEVRRGSLAISGGSLELDHLLATNSAGTIQFGDGDLMLHGSRVANGLGMFLGASGGQATLRFVGGTNRVDTGLTLGNVANSTGTVWLAGGDLVTTNASVSIGWLGVGQMTVSNGTWRGKDVTLGDQAGARGTLTLLGGTNEFGLQLSLGDATNTTGTLSLKGGMLVTTNGGVTIGVSGIGDITVTNGVWLGNTVSLGTHAGARGTLAIDGGTNQVRSFFDIGSVAGATGVVVVSGGCLVMSNETAWVGSSGVGGLAVSNGVWLAKDVWVGNNTGSRGALTLAGGTSQLFSSLTAGQNAGATGTVLLTGGDLVATNEATTLGLSGQGQMTVSGGTWRASSVLLGQNAGATGNLSVAGGNVSVTNATGTGTLEIRRGLLLLNGGSLAADSLLAVNAAGQIQLDDGTLALRGSRFANGSALALGAAGGQVDLWLVGGTNRFETDLRVGNVANSTGTVWLTGGSLVTTNGAVSIGSSGVGSLTVSNGSWRGKDVTLGGQAGSVGTLTQLGGTNEFGLQLILGDATNSTGTLLLRGGMLVTSNAGAVVGVSGRGEMMVSNGTWLGNTVTLGSNGGARGMLTLAGGTNQIGSFFNVGAGAGATGVVLLTGGRLVMSNQTAWVGSSGVGVFTLSNGTWLAKDLWVGNSVGSRGTLMIAGGDNQLFSTFTVGNNAGATGTVLLTGGDLMATNGATIFGASGRGQMTVSGGTWQASSVLLGQNAGATGTLSVANGAVFVTNASGSASLEVRRGSFSIAGGTVILDRLVATNGVQGSLDFNGGTLTTRGTVVSNGAVFAVGDGVSTANLNLLGGTHAIQNGVAVTPNATVSAWGNLVGTLANTGAVVAAGGEFRLLGAVKGPGTWRAESGSTLSFVAGGTVAGFASTGATVRVEGSLTNSGAISNPGGLILVGPDGSNGLLNVTGGSVDGGTIVVRSSGTMKLAATVDTMSSFVTNQGTFQPLADFFTLAGGFRNEAAFTSRNAQVVNVMNGFGNSGSVVLDTNSMLRVNGFGGQPQSGQIALRSGAILQSLALWTNSGTITAAKGSMIAGASVQNEWLIDGAGYVSAALGNRAGGVVRASNGVLTLGGVVTNFAGGTLAATPNAELALNNDLVNQGTMNPQGGSINLPYLTLTNSGTLSGYGTYRAGSIVNGGLASFSGGRVDIEAIYNNLGGKTTQVTSATARFFGAVSNQAGGVFKNTSGNFTFYDTFYNAGLYASDPATNVFSGDLVIGESGAISGGAGDVFQLGGDLTVLNSNGLDIAAATLQFDGGGHTLSLAGTPQIGVLALDSGSHLSILGADLYVGTLLFSTAQITTAQSIFYDEASNPTLGGLTLSLTGGGSLIPVPEPGTLGLLLAALALAAGLRRRRAAA